MTVKAESGKGSVRTSGALKLRHSRWEAARPRPARYPVTGAQGASRGADPHGSVRKTPECARNVRKTLHDKEDNADPVRCSPAVRPSLGVCGRSGYTRLSVPSLFTDRPCVVRSNMLGGGRGRLATEAGAAGQAGKNHRTMRAMRA